MKWILATLFSFLTAACTSQVEKSADNATFAKYEIHIQDTAGLYVENGYSGSMFYLALAPSKAARGMLVLFLPNGQAAGESARINLELATLARDSGLVTVIPSINHNLFLDANALNAINELLLDAKSRFGISGSRIVLGGFSLGGMNAIRFTELSAAGNKATVVEPAGVYAIDPPLDFARMYRSCQKAVALNKAQAAVAEANYFLARLNKEFGGSPESVNQVYRLRSPFSGDVPDGGNSRFLLKVPVRLYSDRDTAWYLENRGVKPEDINSTEGMEMIDLLRAAGNNRAEWINALGKGYRPDGSRHPHSWSLAAPDETLRWILDCLR